MKRIIFTLVSIVMIVCMSSTVFANTYPATVTLDSKTVDVQEGTQNVTLNITFTLTESTENSMLAVYFKLPSGVTLSSYDSAAYEAYITAANAEWTLAAEDDLSNGGFTLCESDSNNFNVGTFSIPVTFIVDTTNAKTYNIELDPDNTMLCDPDSNALNDVEALPTATITVKAAEPVVEYEDKDFTTNVAADTSNLVAADGTIFTNVAKFVGSINLATIKAGLKTGETLKEAGVMLDGVKKAQIDISGNGTVEYKVIFSGITAAQAEGVNIDTYYTANVIKAN